MALSVALKGFGFKSWSEPFIVRPESCAILVDSFEMELK